MLVLQGLAAICHLLPVAALFSPQAAIKHSQGHLSVSAEDSFLQLKPTHNASAAQEYLEKTTADRRHSKATVDQSVQPNASARLTSAGRMQPKKNPERRGSSVQQKLTTHTHVQPKYVSETRGTFGNISQTVQYDMRQQLSQIAEKLSLSFLEPLQQGPKAASRQAAAKHMDVGVYIETYVIPFNFWFVLIGNVVIIAVICMIASTKTTTKASGENTLKKGITDKVMRKDITIEELKSHAMPGDMWMAIDGIVVDITDFVHVHPGGADLLRELAGQDASEEFLDVGHSDFARDLANTRAVGVLVESESKQFFGIEKHGNGKFEQIRAFLKKHLPARLLALFTHEDPYNLHKILGSAVLLHYIVRFMIVLRGNYLMEGSWTSSYSLADPMGFDGSWFSLLSVWLCVLLQISSFQFLLPRNRVQGKPMLWQEWRAHNLIFVLRSLIAFTTYWYATRYGSKSPHVRITLCLIRFGGILCQLYAADVATRALRDSKHESLTSTWPLWEGCPSSVERFLKFYYAIGINQLTWMILSGGTMCLVFGGILVLQSDSLAMTLVRKNIIKTETFHAFYLWNMWHIAFLSASTLQIFLTFQDLTFSNIVIVLLGIYSVPLLVYVCRFYGLSKYGVWLAFLAKIIVDELRPDLGLGAWLVVPAFWIMWAIGQFALAGYVFEYRVRRYLEGGRAKALRLKSRERMSGSLYRLCLEMPTGFSCGLMPGQHLKLHSPNASRGSRFWNGRENLEVDNSEISRSYTPISPADSKTIEVLVKHYPKNVANGFPEGGRASSYLVEELKVGGEVFASGPHGHRIYWGNGEFEVQVGLPKVKPRICAVLAGGSGITPALSVIREVQAEACRKNNRTEALRKQDYETDVAIESFQVLHANHNIADSLPLSFYEDPEQKTQLIPIRVRNIVTGTRSTLESSPEDTQVVEEEGSGDAEKSRWSVVQSKLSKEVIAHSFPAPKEDVVVLVCGPHKFVVDVCQPLLKDMGYNNIIGMW